MLTETTLCKTNKQNPKETFLFSHLIPYITWAIGILISPIFWPVETETEGV